MTALITFLAILVVVISAIYLPRWRRSFILRRPFPAPWLNLVKRRLVFFSKLNHEEQKQLQDLIQLFLADKKFHGCGGLSIDDDMRVSIAAEACLLLLNRKTGIYPKLKHILVYPDAFKASHPHSNMDGTVSQNSHGLLGESWSSGKVILSWDDVKKGAANFHDGHNVTLHEFAHQLDSEDGVSDGTPPLNKTACQTWASVLSKDYLDLQEAMARQHQGVMDFYGATNPAEFFAVATETFFEKPVQLRKEHPALFQQLQNFYQVNPVLWQ